MKAFKIILLAITLTLSSVVIYSCGSKTASTNVEKQGKEHTSEYVCPMHCEGSGSHEAGTCPVCNMDYVKNENHDGHNH